MELNHELLFIDMQKVVVPPKEQLEKRPGIDVARRKRASVPMRCSKRYKTKPSQIGF